MLGSIRRLWVVFIPTVAVGGLIFLVQLGLAAGLGALTAGGLFFQGSVDQAADDLADGRFDDAQRNFANSSLASSAMRWSTQLPQLRLLDAVPGTSIAAANWQALGSAASSISAGTGELLALYGTLSGSTEDERVFQDGSINLTLLKSIPGRVDSSEVEILRSAILLKSLQTGGPFAGPLERAKQRALREIDPIQEAVGALSDIAPLLPDALGAEAPKRYLIAIANQAEMRASAGAPLSLVMVELDQGRIAIPIKGTTSIDLFPPVNRPVQWWGPSGNPFFPVNPRLAPFVNSNTHPNLLYSGQEMARAWLGGDFPAVDGVIVLDLTAIAAVLNATGPIDSPVYGPVTGDQLGEILLVDAYAEFGQEEAAERQAANQALLEALLSRLLSGDDLITSARAIVSTAPGRHFQVWMKEQPLQRLALQAGVAGQVRDPGLGDWSAMYTQNGNQSKVDVFQQRNVLITAVLAEDGSARVTQQMTMTNATPIDRPEGPEERVGYETSWVRNAYLLYVPDAATNYSVRPPGGFAVRPFRNHPQFGSGFIDDGFGQKLVRVVGWTPPGGQAVVSVAYDLPPGTFSPSTGAPVLGDRRLVYRLRAEPQATWNPATLTVRVVGPQGWVPTEVDGAIVTGSTIEVSAIQDQPVTVRLPFRRSD